MCSQTEFGYMAQKLQDLFKDREVEIQVPCFKLDNHGNSPKYVTVAGNKKNNSKDGRIDKRQILLVENCEEGETLSKDK